MFLRGDIWRAVAINRLQAPTLLSLRDSMLAYTAIWDFFSFIGRFSIAFFYPLSKAGSRLKSKGFCCTRVFIWGPFSLCQTKQSATSGIIKGKMECTVGLKQSFQMESKWSICVSTEILIFGNGMASFGWTGPTGQRGPLPEVDHFDWKIST